MRLSPSFQNALGLVLMLMIHTLYQGPPKVATKRQVPLRKSTGVLVGSAIKRIEPEYPARARQQGISGKVVVQVTIDERGGVIATSPISGPDVLREAAVQAARRWKFSPTYLSGIAVAVIGEISFNFEFDGDVVSSPGGASQPRGRTVSANSPLLLLSERQRRMLNKRLDLAAPAPMTVNNPNGTSLGIASATIRSSTFYPEPGSKGGANPNLRNKYAMKADVVLLNRSDQRVVSAGLEFRNALTNEVFYVYPTGLSIGGGKQGNFRIPLMLLNAEPSGLSVKAVGALFGDSSIWGAFPFPPPLNGDTRPLPQTAVDSKPELLSAIHPNYTDEARRNRVRGAVRLGLEIGPDGVVRRLEIINSLPDGLTDEAIRIAQRLSFKPAMKGGGPVPCQINLDIEFKGG